MEETPDQTARPSRPTQPTTPEELRRSLTIVRYGIGFSVVAIALMTWIFIAFFDAPAMPLVPLAILVIAVDFVMLGIFTRQRQRAIDAIGEREGAAPSDN